ncbi:hypothetical protein E2C01_086255 [Portunus trituberculatus]|uniref:Uncharacterized protein n=1 Tax=Portunus trituberculatus TaxID=210409 RepID=A0A5B7J098_PORTR|nr:hypothetical protein [Portunus trituberculatus]
MVCLLAFCDVVGVGEGGGGAVRLWWAASRRGKTVRALCRSAQPRAAQTLRPLSSPPASPRLALSVT